MVRGGVAALSIAGVVFALAASGSSAKSDGGSPGKGSTSHPATADVVVSKCADSSNQFEGPVATVTVTNHSSKSSNYIITVAFESPDGKTQLDTASAIVNNLAAGQKTNEDAQSLKSEVKGKKFVCKVADVTRTSAVG